MGRNALGPLTNPRVSKVIMLASIRGISTQIIEEENKSILDKNSKINVNTFSSKDLVNLSDAEERGIQLFIGDPKDTRQCNRKHYDFNWDKFLWYVKHQILNELKLKKSELKRLKDNEPYIVKYIEPLIKTFQDAQIYENTNSKHLLINYFYSYFKEVFEYKKNYATKPRNDPRLSPITDEIQRLLDIIVEIDYFHYPKGAWSKDLQDQYPCDFDKFHTSRLYENLRKYKILRNLEIEQLLVIKTKEQDTLQEEEINK